MNNTIHLNSDTLTNNFFLTFRVSPSRNFFLIGFVMFALDLILSVWIQASRLYEALTGVHLSGGSSVKVPTCTTTLRAQFWFCVWRFGPASVGKLHWESNSDWCAARPCQPFQVSLSATWNGQPVRDCLRQSVTACLGNYLPSVAVAVARERERGREQL